MKKIFAFIALIIAFALLVTACGQTAENNSVPEKERTETENRSTPDTDPVGDPDDTADSQTEERIEETGNADMEKTLHLFIDGSEMSVEWEDNGSVAALTELVSSGPLTVRMSGYGGFEQVGSLGTALPSDDARITTEAGDVVLYSKDQLVIFYGSNSWAYTRLGRINGRSAAELANLLGGKDVTVKISFE